MTDLRTSVVERRSSGTVRGGTDTTNVGSVLRECSDVHRDQLQEGNHRAQLCEECVEGSDLVRVCRGQFGRGQLQLARQVNSRSSQGAQAGSNLDGPPLKFREKKTR